MDTEHLFLFSKLIYNSRLSIRENNSELSKWHQLRALGLCSILESGRRGTLIIHTTKKAEIIANQFKSILQDNTYA